jgi:hypothetical protein
MGQSKNQFMKERELEASIQDGHYKVEYGYEYWEEFVHVKSGEVVKIFRAMNRGGVKRRETELQKLSIESFLILNKGELVPIMEHQFDDVLTEAVKEMKL